MVMSPRDTTTSVFGIAAAMHPPMIDATITALIMS
jgi:hypothetical protein